MTVKQNKLDKERLFLTPFSYWVEGNMLAAGEYPGNQYSFNPATTLATLAHQFVAMKRYGLGVNNFASWKISKLLDAGITTFIDLTMDRERPRYEPMLHRERRRRGKRTEYYRFPIIDRNIPETHVMNNILDLIDQKISDGESVYVHCFRGLGRTGIVVACYLIRKGMSNEEALKYIPNLRKGVAGDFRASPETDIQRQFVLNWNDKD